MSDRQHDDQSAQRDQDRIRALLGDLPSAGDMPAPVAQRIMTALEVEQRRRVADQPTDTNVTPLVRPAEPRPARERARAQRPWWQPAAGLAAAAAVGALAVLGVQATTRQPTAPTQAASIQVGDVKDGVHVARTGTSYLGSDLAVQAARLTRDASAHPVNSGDLQTLGVLATREGALACAESIGGALSAKPDKIDVDIAYYNGAPALVMVVTKDDRAVAWVLSRTCAKGARPLAGPVAVSL